MVINKKILRTFRANKSRYIGLFLLILLSCLSFTAFQLFAPSALASLDDFWQQTNVEDAHFTLHQPLEDVAALEREFNLQLEEIRHHESVSGNLRMFQETEKINKYGVVDGRGLQGSGEILIDRLYGNNNKVAIGSAISVGGRSFRVVGYMTKPDYIYTLKNHTDILPGTFGIGVISEADFARLESYQTAYSVVFGQDNQDQFRNSLNQHNIVLSWLGREDNPRIAAVTPDLQAKETIGNILPTFILVVTCLIIAVVLWRLLKTEFVQIGTLYALGYKKSDILRHYLVYPLVLCVSGGVVGTLLGLRLAVPLVMIIDGQHYNLPAIALNIRPVIPSISLALPCLFLLPVTWYVVQKALRLSPQELMRGAGNKTTVGWLEQRLNLNRFGFNTKFRIRELVRNIPRAIAMIIGVAFASSLLLVGFVMNDSIVEVVEVGYEDFNKYEYQYVFKGLQFGDPNGAERQAFVPAGVRADGEEILISAYGVEPGGVMLNITNAQRKQISEQVSITRPLAEALNLQTGDKITVRSKVNDLESELVVEEIAETYLGYFLYMPLNAFNETFGMPAESYTVLLSRHALDLDPEAVGFVITSEELQEGFKAFVTLLRELIFVLGVIAVSLGVIIIYILTSLLIEENRYNISLMKVLGYGKSQIFSLVLNSSFILVLLGFALSVPLIRQVVGAIFEEVAEEMNLVIPAMINSHSIFLALGLITLAFWLSNLASRRKVWAVSMADSLKNREE